MSDPIFLRNLINNTVYAEQIHSAQQMAQEAAREKNIRVQQQEVREKALAVEKLDHSANLQVGEEGQEKQEPSHQEDQTDLEENDSTEAKADKKQERKGGVQRIDITV